MGDKPVAISSGVDSPEGYHTHVNERGMIVKCYHNCKSLFGDWKFFVGVTVSWPLEHFLYSHVWPFKLLADIIGV